MKTVLGIPAKHNYPLAVGRLAGGCGSLAVDIKHARTLDEARDLARKMQRLIREIENDLEGVETVVEFDATGKPL